MSDKASVAAVFKLNDADATELRFTRSITGKGGTEYRIDKKVRPAVQPAPYRWPFSLRCLDIHGPHLLVHLSPTDRTHALLLMMLSGCVAEQVVSWDTYNAKLESLNLMVKARNFLVFQVNPF